jgi:hypothetical protein
LIGFDLNELRSLPLPRAEASDGALPVEKEYAQRWLPPRLDESGGVHCVGCGSLLTGGLSGLLLGTFDWGIVHGEGYCRECHYPVRMYHYLPDALGEERRINYPLQPHPDDLKLPEEVS